MPSSSRSSSRRKFLGAKRFSLEGAETLIPLLDLAIDEAAAEGCTRDRDRHGPSRPAERPGPTSSARARATSSGSSRTTIPELHRGRGDVKYHLGFSSDQSVDRRGIQDIHLSLCFNPSHLEFVDPVVRWAGCAPSRTASATPHRRVPGHRDPRRRGVRRPGRRRRRRSTSASSTATGPAAPSTSSSTTRSASPPLPTRGALDPLRDRRGADAPDADLPRQRRGSRGGRAGRAAGAWTSAQSSASDV